MEMETVYAWQNDKESIHARWGSKTADFRDFAEIMNPLREYGEIASATIVSSPVQVLNILGKHLSPEEIGAITLWDIKVNPTVTDVLRGMFVT